MEFENVKEFIKNYHDMEYHAPSKMQMPDKKYYEDIYFKAKEAKMEFNNMLSVCSEKYYLTEIKETQFLDGSKTKVRNYFWGQLKNADYFGCPASISLFCEYDYKLKDTRYRVSLEISDKKAKKEDYKKYLTALDLKLKDPLFYTVGQKNLEIVKCDNKKMKQNIENQAYSKFNISYIIDPNSKDMQNEIMKGIELIRDYYDYIINGYRK